MACQPVALSGDSSELMAQNGSLEAICGQQGLERWPARLNFFVLINRSSGDHSWLVETAWQAVVAVAWLIPRCSARGLWLTPASRSS